MLSCSFNYCILVILNVSINVLYYLLLQIVGYKGRAVVVVSCVTKDLPYRPHPHKLIGRDNCKRGICTIEINNESMTASFQNLGIQCVKKKDIDDALKMREEIRVDPFRSKLVYYFCKIIIIIEKLRHISF